MVWLYVAVALAAAAGALLLRRFVKNKPAKRLLDAWGCLATGACFFVMWALEHEDSLFPLAIGMSCIVAGLVALWDHSRRVTSTGR